VSKQRSQRHLWTTLWHAIALKANLYENARNTPKTHRLAFTIVILAALSHMLGSAVILFIIRGSGWLLLLALLIDGISVVAGYYLWTFIIFKVGQWLKTTGPTYGDLLGPIGFAYAPQVLNVLTLVPLLGRPIELILATWSLLAVIVATREGLDIRTRKAAIICIVGWIPIQVAIGFVQQLEQAIVS